jgi:uncharacterized protein (TIGR00299 family) protein
VVDGGRASGSEGDLRIGYFDCCAGASGDMIMACLFDLGFAKSSLEQCIAGLGIGEVGIDVSDVMRKQIKAKAFRVKPPAAPERRGYSDIVRIIEKAHLSEAVRHNSTEAFRLLAEAEAAVHGMRKEDVHFHEVGAVDSIVDVVGAFLGIEALGIEKVVCSPLALGSGSVECEHGVLPVPAPATLKIAEGLPVRGWDTGAELTTPTGAAILKVVASSFGPIPAMTITEVGCGAGMRDLAGMPNVMRLILGEACRHESDEVVLVETNIDDMNPQFFSHLYEDLLAGGALDVWVTDIMMKKGRPGFLLSVLAERSRVPHLADLVFAGTTTSGVRLTAADRIKLRRESAEVETRYGSVRVKVFMLDSHRRCVPEYEDCLRISRAKGVSIDRVIEEARHVCWEIQKDKA